MSTTTKQPTKLDYEQSIQEAYNDVNATLSVDGFLAGKVGHKVVLTIESTQIEEISGSESNNTELYSFYDGTTLLYQIRVIYTDSTRSLMFSAERTA